MCVTGFLIHPSEKIAHSYFSFDQICTLFVTATWPSFTVSLCERVLNKRRLRTCANAIAHYSKSQGTMTYIQYIVATFRVIDVFSSLVIASEL